MEKRRVEAGFAPGDIQIFESLTRQMWPGVPVVPAMSTGATDSRVMRNAGIRSDRRG